MYIIPNKSVLSELGGGKYTYCRFPLKLVGEEELFPLVVACSVPYFLMGYICLAFLLRGHSLCECAVVQSRWEHPRPQAAPAETVAKPLGFCFSTVGIQVQSKGQAGVQQPWGRRKVTPAISFLGWQLCWCVGESVSSFSVSSMHCWSNLQGRRGCSPATTEWSWLVDTDTLA